MRPLIPMLLSIIFANQLNAQIRQEVIASAGGNSTMEGMSVSWTLGETVIPTFTKGNLILSQGYQHQLIITSVKEPLRTVIDIKVFPNPAGDVLNIQLGAPANGETSLKLIDYQGNILKMEIIESTVSVKQVNMQGIPAGIYYLRMTYGKLINVYKVVKL